MTTINMDIDPSIKEEDSEDSEIQAISLSAEFFDIIKRLKSFASDKRRDA